MKINELKSLFVSKIFTKNYAPNIFSEEYWAYCNENFNEFTPFYSKWMEFKENYQKYSYENFIKTYNEEVSEVSSLLENCKEDIISTFGTEHKKEECFTELNEGKYLCIDLSYAFFQILINNGFIKDDFFEKFPIMKWKSPRVNAFNSSLIPRFILYNECKKILSNIIKVTFGEEILNNAAIIGDCAYIPYEEKYDGLINNNSVLNGIKCHVFSTEKRILKTNIGYDIHCCINNEAKFYNGETNLLISYDYYPQIFKKLKDEVVIEKDLIFGYDDVVSSFNKKIWED